MDPRIINALRAKLAGLLAEHPELADDETLRADTLEGATDLHWVVSRLVMARREADADAERNRELAKLYTGRAAAADRRSDAFDRALMALLDAAQLPKIKVPEGTVSVVAGRPGVAVTDEALLPGWAFKVMRTVSKSAIADAFKDGLPCPGAVMTDGAPHIAIR